MEPKKSYSFTSLTIQDLGLLTSTTERKPSTAPSVIVIARGISGVPAAQTLHNASFEVLMLESLVRIGGRIHTDYSFGCPVDMGASWSSIWYRAGEQIQTLSVAIATTTLENPKIYMRD